MEFGAFGEGMVNCNHQDHHQTHSKATSRLLAAFAVISIFMVVEVVGGIIAGSLALLADATHMLTDAAALALAASAQFFAARPADSRLHFGYRRAQVLAAFVNGILLAVLLCWIVYEAIRRFMQPISVDSGLMLWIAAAGLLANAIAFFILHRRGEENLNVRGALLHVMSDLLGSVAAIIAAIVIITTGWMAIDPLLSIAVAVLIGFSAFRLVRETGFILLEGAPSAIDVEKLKEGLKLSSDKIVDVHRVQISQITPEQLRLTLHACVKESEDAAEALKEAKMFLEQEYNIKQSTIQVEIGGKCPDIGDGAKKFEVHENQTEVKPNLTANGGAAAFAASD
ncbi:cation diffusion facilitator family transporter [Hyphococcus flavus]|uniref:Cation diffusion facilitator family transporter n=1 Tax=Hyphococcus flavus TaxID=1866326 RepID=A0AAE9ZB39_9PROT|nr:cation diffusion facilitator family transporter [Hyphococcus flavus]WDI31238.1 cation diffusion facilitator family transporter [Hyphococcus flavus]